MIVLIPLGGIGVRFSQNGYTSPKALIPVMGKPILFWLLDHLVIPPDTLLCIPYNKVYRHYRLEDQLRKTYPQYTFHFHCLEQDTRGAAETIVQALNSLHVQDISDQPILCLDGDNFYTCDILRLWNRANCVFTFQDTQPTPLYSYIEPTHEGGELSRIVEKEKISNYACTGAYGFASYASLRQYCQYILDHNIRQRDEFYTSTVIQEMLRVHHSFQYVVIPAKEFICLGTPTQVRLFCHNYPQYNSLTNQCLIEPKRYCFDLDNTLVTFPKVAGDYTTVEPIPKTIEFVRYLKRFGHTIIIYTARRMRTHRGNVGKIVKDIGQITMDTLDRFSIPYDELYFGKPEAQVYVDDLALNAFADLEKETGYYETMIKPRDFNTIHTDTMQLCTKESSNLEGEIYYYQNIPPSLKDMFPIMVDYDTEENKWYRVEKINGITASNLYLSQLLTPGQLKHIMNSIFRLQSSEIEPQTQTQTHTPIDILSNYIPKMRERYASYDYSRFPNATKTIAAIEERLKDYRGHISRIHGDPVFPNILINDYGKIKLIDMRGKVGQTLTVYGDRLYDWAKLYQSLIGYDEIHEDKWVSSEYKTTMINCFVSYFHELYPYETTNQVQPFSYLKAITQSLLFSLIPLHDNEKCMQYYGLIDSPYLV